MRTGLKNICPDIPEEKWVSLREQRRRPRSACRRPATCSPRIPDAKKMAVVGLNDGGVLALIQAAEQLGRADEVIGWGQDGAFITGDNVNPHLAGIGVLLPRGLCGLRAPRRDRADRRRQPAAAQGRCRRSRLAGRALPGVSAEAGQGGAGHAGAREAAPRGARRAPPSTSCSARTSKPSVADDRRRAIATPPAATAGARFRASAAGGRARLLVAAWLALIAATGALPRRLPVAPDGARDHLHHVDRRRARGRAGDRRDLAAAFSISASRAA